MEKEVDPEVIKATQSSLGKYVKRPPLTEKLLKKPPFRFLHDIVTSVKKSTGFFEDLFEEDELVSENVKDRDSKIAFLNKVISVLYLTTGKSLNVKPSKIVAGQEPDKTNELLQCLAEALDKELSSDEAVNKFKEGANAKAKSKPQQDEKKAKEPPVKKNEVKKLTSRSSEKLNQTTEKKARDRTERSQSQPRNEKDKPIINSKLKSKETTTVKKESPPKKITQSLPTKSISKKNSIDKFAGDANQSSDKSKRKVAKAAIENEHSNDENKRNFTGLSDKFLGEATNNDPLSTKPNNRKLNATSYTIDNRDLNSSLSSQDLMNVDDNHDENTITNTEQNNLRKDEDDQLVRQTNDGQMKVPESGSTETATEVKRRNSNFDALETKTLSASKETVRDEIVSITTVNQEIKTESPKIERAQSVNTESPTTVEKAPTITRPASVRPSSSRPGAPRLRDKHEAVAVIAEPLLVGKVNIIVENPANEEEEDSSIIIVEQPEVESTPQEQQLESSQHGHLVQQILDSQKEFSQTTGKTEIEWQFGAQKAREALNQEIEQLRFNIQALSRAANPLGKVLDHIQEDVEVMRQELLQWTAAYEDASTQLAKQKQANEESLVPLTTRLRQLEADIAEKRDKITDKRILIHKHSTRIEKLLSSGNVQ